MQAISLCASYLDVLVRHPSLEMEAFGENQALRREGKLCTAPPFHAYVGKRLATKLAPARFVNPVLFSRLSNFKRFRYLYLRWHYYFVLFADIIAVLAGDIRPGGLSELRPPKNSKAIYFQKKSFTRLKGTEMDQKYVMHHSKIRSCMKFFFLE